MEKTQNFQRKDIPFMILKNLEPKPFLYLRFGQHEPIEAPYLISKADFIACHFFKFLENEDMLSFAKNEAKFLLNSPYSKDEVWDQLPYRVQQQLIEKKTLNFL